jgi:hypothetical protein
MRALLALALLTAAASSAHAGDHEVTIGSEVRALRSTSANALTSDSLGSGVLGYAHAVPIDLLPGLGLWATAAYRWGSVEGTMFQTLTTSLDTLSLTVGGRARYPLRRWIVAEAALDLGSARAAVSLDDGAGHSASDNGWGATVKVAAGLEVLLVRTRRVSLGIRLDLGYVEASRIGLSATPASGSDGTLQLAMDTASLGQLDLSGPVFATSVLSQF